MDIIIKDDLRRELGGYELLGEEYLKISVFHWVGNAMLPQGVGDVLERGRQQAKLQQRNYILHR